MTALSRVVLLTKKSGILNKGDLFYDGVAGEFKIEGFGE